VITWPAAFAGGLHIQDFLAHIETAKTIAGAKPVWLVVQAFENLLQWRMPAFEEMTAMVYLALNRDVRGLVYFLYQSVPTGENLQGLVDLAGQPTANWSQMAAFHQQLEPVRNAILWSQKIAPFASAAFPVDVGCFQHQLGFRYVLAANREVTAATATTVSIPTSLLPGVTAVFDEVTGEQLPLASSPDGVSVSLSLGPGGGRMLRVCTGE
jgi:hypothetical protein